MAERILIDAPHLLDVVDGRWLADRRILVADDRIEAILGPDDAVPDDARPLAIDGDWVVPGLIDCHGHLVGEMEYAGIPAIDVSPAQEAMSGVRNARDTLRAGFTTVRDVGTFWAFVDVALRDAIDRGWTPGPRMQCAGAYITCPGGGGEVTGDAPAMGLPDGLRVGVVRDEAEVRAKVRTLIARRRRPDQVHRHRRGADPRDGPGRRRAVGGRWSGPRSRRRRRRAGSSRRTRTAPRGSSSRSGPASARSSTPR